MITILESAIMHNYDINPILKDFAERVGELGGFYGEPQNLNYYVEFLYQLSIYRFKEGKPGLGIDAVLRAIEYADSLKDDTSFKKCVALFESYRSLAVKHQKKRYKSIQNSILGREKDPAKNTFFDDSIVKIV
ncbi:hypothetical protein [Paenibacillus sp. 1-18]|uniref:hypothetical protein n=1 Tax=Paenibacillus sp. 1-18 TaxID=1333846 RepID=UPI0004BC6F09|nr:hypothetical protein [Paenibacillus sp. 1-18]